MIGWICSLLLAACWVFAWRRSCARERRTTQELARRLEDLASGRDPGAHPAETGLPNLIEERLQTVEREQRRWRERALGEEANHRTVLGCMEEGLMVVDRQHMLRQINPSFLQLFDIKGDPCGQTVLRTLREPEFEEIVSAALETGEPQSREVTRGGRSPRHFAVHAVPMRDAEGKPGVVTVFRDVSRLRQLEDVRRDFVANVSHELRTPLAIFHGYLENLVDDPKMPRTAQAEIFAVMSKHSRRLNALIEDLLILARLESRHEGLKPEEIEVASFVGEVLTAWQGRAREKHVRLVSAAPDSLPVLTADRRRLEQVFYNLLENALKYTDKGGRITVSAKEADDQLEFRVEDTGLGIPPADLPHIFERFYRADKARSREQGGTGLGLSIVKHIIQSHGGTVRAESTYEKGASIIFRLPFNQSQSSPAPEEEPVGVRLPLETVKA